MASLSFKSSFTRLGPLLEKASPFTTSKHNGYQTLCGALFLMAKAWAHTIVTSLAAFFDNSSAKKTAGSGDDNVQAGHGFG